jgi:hypothetical protein
VAGDQRHDGDDQPSTERVRYLERDTVVPAM